MKKCMNVHNTGKIEGLSDDHIEDTDPQLYNRFAIDTSDSRMRLKQ
jgi:hypothetical protein